MKELTIQDLIESTAEEEGLNVATLPTLPPPTQGIMTQEEVQTYLAGEMKFAETLSALAMQRPWDCCFDAYLLQ